MIQLQSIFIEFSWYLIGMGAVLVLATKLFANHKVIWPLVGCILLIIAIGNAAILLNSGLSPSQTMAGIVGLGLHGSLGSRFIGNWLTDGAT